MFALVLIIAFPNLEMLDSVELGETAHKKAGTTVPESIHSFSKCVSSSGGTFGLVVSAKNPW